MTDLLLFAFQGKKTLLNPLGGALSRDGRSAAQRPPESGEALCASPDSASFLVAFLPAQPS